MNINCLVLPQHSAVVTFCVIFSLRRGLKFSESYENFLSSDSSCLHVNCGGKDATIKESKQKIIYQGDENVQGGPAKFYLNPDEFWGFSSTGDFMDDNDKQNLRYSVSLSSSNLTVLDATARRSPISLTYFHYCLENGMYTVKLRFAEIQFTNDRTYNSLGRRVFDIYIQVIKFSQEHMDIHIAYLFQFSGTLNLS